MNEHDATREELLTAAEDLSADALAHLASCEACAALAETLAELDAGLMQFRDIELPDGLLDRTMEAVSEPRVSNIMVERAPVTAPPFSLMGLLAGLLEALFVGLFAWPVTLLAGLRDTWRKRPASKREGLSTQGMSPAPQPKRPSMLRSRWPLLLGLPAGAATVACLGLGMVTWTLDRADTVVVASAGGGDPWASEPEAPPQEPAGIVGLEGVGGSPSQAAEYEGEAAVDEPSLDMLMPQAEASPSRTGGWRRNSQVEGGAHTIEVEDDRQRPPGSRSFGLGGNTRLGMANARLLPSSGDAEGEDEDEDIGELANADASQDAMRTRTRESERGRFEATTRADPTAPAPPSGSSTSQLGPTPVQGNLFDTALANGLRPRAEANLSRSNRDPGVVFANAEGRVAQPLSNAASWLLERDRHAGHAFQAAEGYWANTYIPGDARMRLMRHRLAQSGGNLAGSDRSALALAEEAVSNTQHLDPPRSGALALRLSADRAMVEGPQRVLLQVGIRGAARRAGRRPTLRVNVVLDLRRPLDATQQANVRALLTELSRARTGADRMGLVILGPAGSVAIPLSDFRYGVVAVALDRAFGNAEGGAVLSLGQGMRRAVEAVGVAGDEAESDTLGSGLVLVLSPDLTPSDAEELVRASHAGVLAGVTTTAIGLSESVAVEPLNRVALAGAGRRRVLSEATGARDLVRDEINAVSRVVARAVRLRVRLAPGVQLIDVLGSHRLDRANAERVRQAEQAVDQQLSHRLGIRADRGEDEDGIQIVIPAFYADDSHVVLLDVVVPNAGPVADVSLRFKDLLNVSNNTANARLSLPRGNLTRGPREHAVLRNLLAHDLSQAYEQAAADVSSNDRAGATRRLNQVRALLTSAPASLPALAHGGGLERDVRQVDRFLAVLREAPAPDTVVDCFNYASHRRLNDVSAEFQ